MSPKSHHASGGDRAMKVSPKFSNTSAYITLVSSDSVLFHVESDHLRSASVVFRDMFDAATHSSKETLLLDAPAKSATLFLQLCVCNPLPELTIVEVRTCMALVDKYDEFGLRNEIFVGLQTAATTHP
ncbi:hypothetical protein Q5752_006555 [Cryptotrichosporon argae]